MKKLVYLSFLLFTSFSAFAESVEFTSPSDLLEAARSAFSTLLSLAIPVIGGGVVLSLTVWGVFALIIVLKAAFCKVQDDEDDLTYGHTTDGGEW